MSAIQPKKRRALPPAEEGWFDVSFSGLPSGELAVLRADFDCRSALRQRHEILAQMRDPAVAPVLPPLLRPDTRAQICVEGAMVTRKPFALEVPFPKFDGLPGGKWIVSDARSSGRANARILDRNSDILGRLNLGDGIEHLQCDTAGNIWVGYFDEGVFSSENALGASGLNRFDEQGRITWQHNDPNYFIADCYAMVVSDDAAWCCPYPDFPILRIDSNNTVRSWTGAVAGARAMAVHGNLLLFAGGYTRRSRTGSLVRIEGGDAKLVREFDLGLDLRSAMMSVGRDHRLHVVADDEWLVFEVAHVAEQLGIELS